MDPRKSVAIFLTILFVLSMLENSHAYQPSKRVLCNTFGGCGDIEKEEKRSASGYAKESSAETETTLLKHAIEDLDALYEMKTGYSSAHKKNSRKSYADLSLHSAKPKLNTNQDKNVGKPTVAMSISATPGRYPAFDREFKSLYAGELAGYADDTLAYGDEHQFGY